MWQELVLVLKKIASLYNELLTLSKEKKKIIIAVQVKELSEIVKREEIIMSVIGKLEHEHETVLTSILMEYNITSSKLKMANLIQFCDKKTGAELLEIAEKIKAISQELSVNNQCNVTLLEKALSLVNFNINMLSQVQVGPTYGATQDNTSQEVVVNRAIFDQKI